MKHNSRSFIAFPSVPFQLPQGQQWRQFTSKKTGATEVAFNLPKR
jgi:hypothetical protein